MAIGKGIGTYCLSNCYLRLTLKNELAMKMHFIPDQFYLPFFALGQTPGVARTFFPSVVNSFSDAIYIPGGFQFGQNNHTTVYVRGRKCYLITFTIAITGFFQWIFCIS